MGVKQVLFSSVLLGGRRHFARSATLRGWPYFMKIYLVIISAAVVTLLGCNQKTDVGSVLETNQVPMGGVGNPSGQEQGSTQSNLNIPASEQAQGGQPQGQGSSPAAGAPQQPAAPQSR
jgi:hypothetical protein